MVFLTTVKWGATLVRKHLQKGEMFSYFQFGGSDCVVVFERQANVDVTAKVNTHYPIRSQYAISNINKLARPG
jgi:phosphatidylserine decarboxylase